MDPEDTDVWSSSATVLVVVIVMVVVLVAETPMVSSAAKIKRKDCMARAIELRGYALTKTLSQKLSTLQKQQRLQCLMAFLSHLCWKRKPGVDWPEGTQNIMFIYVIHGPFSISKQRKVAIGCNWQLDTAGRLFQSQMDPKHLHTSGSAFLLKYWLATLQQGVGSVESNVQWI